MAYASLPFVAPQDLTIEGRWEHTSRSKESQDYEDCLRCTMSPLCDIQGSSWTYFPLYQEHHASSPFGSLGLSNISKLQSLNYALSPQHDSAHLT